MNIIGSVLEQNETSFIASFDHLLPFVDKIQIDIADGQNVPNTTLSLEKTIALLQKKQFSNSLEFHLMTNTPNKDVKLLAMSQLPISCIYVHGDFFKHHTLVSLFPLGAVLYPENKVNETVEYIINFPHLQIMTTHPGRQGPPFLPTMLQKITQLREYGYKGTITLDGGINETTIHNVLTQPHLPDSLVVGSYLLKNPKDHYSVLSKLLTPQR